MGLETRSRAQQIADYYISLIKIGMIKEGDVLPGRGEISDLWDVGRMVAQQALELVRRAGYAVTKPKVGTYALCPGPTPPLEG